MKRSRWRDEDGSEADKKRPIRRKQDARKEGLDVALMTLKEPLLTAAAIHDEPEAERRPISLGEEVDPGLDTIVKSLDVFPFERCHQPSRRIAGRKGDVHQPDLNADGWRLLRDKPKWNEHRERGQTGHESLLLPDTDGRVAGDAQTFRALSGNVPAEVRHAA